MIISVRVAGETFEVEIEDLAARPVRARIGEEQFEVWPDPAPAALSAAAPPRPRLETVEPSAPGANVVLAPLPGVLISVAVQPGDTVVVGQALCVLEAMKMNNTVRAARPGRIAAVRAVAGQTVRHRQVLLEYAAAASEPA